MHARARARTHTHTQALQRTVSVMAVELTQQGVPARATDRKVLELVVEDVKLLAQLLQVVLQPRTALFVDRACALVGLHAYCMKVRACTMDHFLMSMMGAQ